LAIPFLFFGPPSLKILGVFLSVFLQILIILSGNFCFFNFLTILLHLFLINDSFYPFNFARSLNDPNILLESVFGIFLGLNILRFLGLFFKKFESLRILPAFCLLNSYGLFARMTTKRYEINLEGSLDGNSWQRIPFKYKVEDLCERGLQIAPLQPRLDWQMWFLALDPTNLSPWFNNFLEKIFKGSEEVISLLGDYPFKDQAPKFIRVSVALYKMSNFKEKKENGKFWIKEDLSSFVVES
jgi:lipase maturation factor 1